MKTLLDEAQIRDGVVALGKTIAADYRGKPLTVLGVLTGSIILLSDLIRQINVPLRVALIQASSYRGKAVRPGELTIDSGLLPDIAGRDVLIVDDIFDTGRTLSQLVASVGEKGPNSVRSAVLLWKEGRAEVEYTPDYSCFTIPDVFVVGYGLDYNDDYRHLPYIAALDESDL
ncbi:MAG: hypoxanthine phosphoribosyltransferase [Planctomycetaceae bacterium]